MTARSDVSPNRDFIWTAVKKLAVPPPPTLRCCWTTMPVPATTIAAPAAAIAIAAIASATIITAAAKSKYYDIVNGIIRGRRKEWVKVKG